ncbi:LRR receptor-like serine/threonine-protein kinase FEI 1 [Rutidosis leptorrhynchoides]|uniref:LRR receptor-like serine/threonine-protein kinase FEI 1 n=1 Tax=Rutidosis leptorrhynchoides TaxID=125765 RepID=UPI003A9987C5
MPRHLHRSGHRLSYLHRKNIIHRNLAAIKIFLDLDLVPRISGMDLAFRRYLDNFSDLFMHYDHVFTSTEGYRAPECYEPNYEPSEEADVYAFGILLLEMLCEKPPWKSLVMLALEFSLKGELPKIRHGV